MSSSTGPNAPICSLPAARRRNRHVHAVFALVGIALVAGFTFGCAPAPVAEEPFDPVDVSAARRLAQKNNCMRCHSLTRQKEGPTYAEVAVKYRTNADAEERLYEHLVRGESIMADGHKEHHKIIRAQSPEQIRNLVHWILAQ